jgi:predicted transposase/invertase (TIGR01784 family)
MGQLISFDWAMKKILRSKANFDVLEGFLSELIAPDRDLKIVRLLESESNKDQETDKLNRVDILVEIVPGDIVLIEVQVNTELDFLHRILFGTSKIITEYIAQGEAYAKIKKVYSVNILYFDLGAGEDYLYKGTTDFLGMHNQKPLALSARQQSLYKKTLVRDVYPEYFLIKVNNFDNLAKNTLDEWIYFLKNEDIKKEFSAKGLLKAKEVLDMMNLSEEDRLSYKKHQNNLHYQASIFESSYGEGKAEGLREGKAEGKAEGLREGKAKTTTELVQRMLKHTLSIEKIAELTGLSEANISSIAAKLTEWSEANIASIANIE